MTSYNISRNTILFILIILSVICVFSISPVNSFKHIFAKGSQLRCREEGQVVVIPFLKSDPCITCLCQNSTINCFKDSCPQQGLNCYYQQTNSTNFCCSKCKGCTFKGKFLANGETAQDESDVCLSYQCNSGVVTSHRSQCFVPCSNPVSLRGICCPSCTICPRWNAKDGQEVLPAIAKKDPCIRCHCFKGQLICTRKICPVLPCPKSNWLQPLNSCCPVCKGKKDVQKLPEKGSCLLADKTYRHEDTFHYDECTNCLCQNGTSICHRQAECRCELEENGTEKQEKCCGSCALASSSVTVKSMSSNCHYKNKVYKENEQWASSDNCEKCTCLGGKVHCSSSPQSRRLCPPQPIACPSGYQRVKLKGECCETCLQTSSTCHLNTEHGQKSIISTFDGVRYRFAGQCNYVLMKDCNSKRLAVHLLNRFRRTSTANATFEGISLMVKIENTKIHLGHLGAVRVNHTKVALPYIQLGHFTIDARSDNRIKVRASKMEFEVLFTVNVSVEVKAKNSHQGSLCGLCGNFNGNADDEFQLKNSKRIASLEKFARSFQVGQNLVCPKRRAIVVEKSLPQNEKVHQTPSPQTLAISGRICERIQRRYPQCLRSSTAFQQCLTNMSICFGDQFCECRALERFIENCSGRRANAVKRTFCKRNSPTTTTINSCPLGSEFKTCTDGCRKTCKNRSISSEQCHSSRGQCRPGCQCIGNRVWHGQQCIPQVMCP